MKKKQPILRWVTVVQSHASIIVGDRKLYMAMQGGGPGKVGVLAVEAPASGTANQILDNHAHQLVYEGKSERVAVRRADAYAQKWVDGQVAAKKCECSEIKTKRKKRS